MKDASVTRILKATPPNKDLNIRNRKAHRKEIQPSSFGPTKVFLSMECDICFIQIQQGLKI